VGHTEIQAFGESASPQFSSEAILDELGIYRLKHDMMPQTHYALPTESNGAMTDGGSVSAVAYIPPLKRVGFTPLLIKTLTVFWTLA